MPASLVEAFISPFDKVPGGRPPVMSSGSTDIRNGGDGRDAYGQPGGYNHVATAPVNTCQPEYQQDYRISDVVTEADDLKATYGHDRASAPHDCDRLISQIMSCSVCRKKLQKIMAQEVHDAAHRDSFPEERHHRRQSGGDGRSAPTSGLLGEFTDLLHSDFIVNFLIGIAVIFLLDRIIAMKLR
jgi:hypothetical protein